MLSLIYRAWLLAQSPEEPWHCRDGSGESLDSYTVAAQCELTGMRSAPGA